MAKVSVIIPCFNAAPWVGAAIESVRAQTFGDWELVIVDDGSEDESADVIARHLGDPRVGCLRQANRGRSAARNRGIAASTGGLVAFLDADDLWLPGKLAAQVAAMDASPAAGLCYTACDWIDAEGRPIDGPRARDVPTGWQFPRMVRENFIACSSALARRDCLAAVGPFDEALSASEDWDLWLRLSRRYPVAATGEALTLHRVHGSNTGWRSVLEGGQSVLGKVLADPEARRLAGMGPRQARARNYVLVARDAGEFAGRRAALGLVASAVALHPPVALQRDALVAFAKALTPGALRGPLRRLQARWT